MKLKVSMCVLMASLCLLLTTTLNAAETTAPPPNPVAPPAAAADLLTTLANTPHLTTLVTLIKAAGLEDALKQAGPFTLFAPTDAAFAKVPKADLDALMKPENKELLKSILLYHVVNGKFTVKDLLAMKNPTAVTTLNGGTLMITHKKHVVMVNKARITMPDVMASNGVIQLVDAVLMPPKK